MEKVDIFLQGKLFPYTNRIAEIYSQFEHVNNVIISTWKEHENDVLSKDPNVKYVFSDLPSYDGIGWRNYQIVGCQEGLKKVETDFSIKMRTDQLYDENSFNVMYDFYQQYKTPKIRFEDDSQKPLNTICVAGGYTTFPFHPREHIFWGNSQDLQVMFDIPLDDQPWDGNNLTIDYTKVTRPETYICQWYYAKFNSKIYEYIKNPAIYLADNAPKSKEAFEVYMQLISKVFKPFPRTNVDFSWPKYNLRSYYYDYVKTHGQFWHENDVYYDL